MQWDKSWPAGFPPWIYAAMARDCVLYSNDHRGKPVDDRAVTRMRNLFSISHDEKEDHPDFSYLSVLGGYVYEQIPYQVPIKEELARAYLLWVDTPGTEGWPGSVDWTELLGGSIEDALAVSFMIAVGVMKNGGHFDPQWLASDAYQALGEMVPAAAVARAVMDKLTATIAEARADGRSAPELPPAYQRYAYNPLIKTPLMDIGDGLRYAPQPQFLLRAMAPQNLYYRGMRLWADKNFGAIMGARVAAYTGRQLQHTGEHTVFQEFRWNKKGVGGIDSSDWFLITPQATILIECKSAQMKLGARAGTLIGLQEANETISKAYRQLANNAAEIRTGNTAYAAIPSGRPLIGLVVTAEPFYHANDRAVRMTIKDPGLPVLTVSLRDIEMLAVLSPSQVGTALLAIVQDDVLNTWMLSKSLAEVLPDFDKTENQLIDETFDRVFLPMTGRGKAE